MQTPPRALTHRLASTSAAASAPAGGTVGSNSSGSAEVVIALGSNQGNRVQHVVSGIKALAKYGIKVISNPITLLRIGLLSINR